MKKLQKHVENICTFTKRNFDHPAELLKCAEYIQSQLPDFVEQVFTIEGNIYKNIVYRKEGLSDTVLIIGAHYDVCGNQPGADDNASACAVLIELIKKLEAREILPFTVEAVFYSLEEPPNFGTEAMGSYFHATKAIEMYGEDNILAMICLEMLGCYSSEANSQSYGTLDIHPLHLAYGHDKGDFLAVVSTSKVYDEVVCYILPEKTEPKHIYFSLKQEEFAYSDHISYEKFGIRNILITDTAFLRNKNYHKKSDTPDTLDYKKMAETVDLLYTMIGNSATLMRPSEQFDPFLCRTVEAHCYKLPVTVYLYEFPWGDREPMIKVQNVYGYRSMWDSFFHITIEEEPKIIGDVDLILDEDIELVKAFIKRNRATLLSIWSGDNCDKGLM